MGISNKMPKLWPHKEVQRILYAALDRGRRIFLGGLRQPAFRIVLPHLRDPEIA
jgi:hypothetical protein